MVPKRAFDLFFTVPALVLLTPLFIVVGIWIKLDTAGPIFFRQVRVGRHEKPFKIFKLRTMQVDTEKQGQLTVGNDKRVTRSGRWLRKYKLDELPQLFNVLKGEMSLVGPRPEVPRYVAYYHKKSRDLIFSIPPGITDLASIKFKNENAILEKSPQPEKTYIEKILPLKIQYYENYISRLSLWFDLKIILTTIITIIKT